MGKPFLRMTMLLALLAAAGMTGGVAGCAAGGFSGGTDAAALRRGRAILVTECATCHRLFPPSEYAPEQWGGIVKRMAARASLSVEQAADLELYLKAASGAGK